MSMAKEASRWAFVAACPPREVFSVMEQMIGTYPYRYEVVAQNAARILEFRRKGLVGQWSKRVSRRTRWVTCNVEETAEGTVVQVAASRGLGPLPRALQLIHLLTRGVHDARTVYRDRRVPPGPVTLVASWAGMAYPLYTEPSWESPRGPAVYTATRIEAVEGGVGPFTRVRLSDGTIGYIENDQIVVAPERATRRAQEEAARSL